METQNAQAQLLKNLSISSEDQTQTKSKSSKTKTQGKSKTKKGNSETLDIEIEERRAFNFSAIYPRDDEEYSFEEIRAKTQKHYVFFLSFFLFFVLFFFEIFVLKLNYLDF